MGFPWKKYGEVEVKFFKGGSTYYIISSIDEGLHKQYKQNQIGKMCRFLGRHPIDDLYIHESVPADVASKLEAAKKEKK